MNPNQVRSVEQFKRQVFKLILSASRVEQELFLQKMHHDLNITFETLRIDFESFRRYQRNVTRNKHLITDADRGGTDRLVYKVNKDSPDKQKQYRAEEELLFLMMKDRKYSTMFNNDKGVFMQDKMHQQINNLLFVYYSIFDTFDRTAFI